MKASVEQIDPIHYLAKIRSTLGSPTAVEIRLDRTSIIDSPDEFFHRMAPTPSVD